VCQRCDESVPRQDDVEGKAREGRKENDNSLVGSFAAMRRRYLLDTEDWTSEVIATG
jgi:hypothetical protein